jgi:hypothetical protein
VTITNRVSLKSVMSGNTPIADVVDAPTIGAATAGIESATVAYTAAATGGAATSFTAISTPGSVTGTGSSPITVSGLTGGTAYTFKVYGTNAAGVWSAVQSSASNSVTPEVATSFESIATATGNGSSGTITFSSIPNTYKHLQIRLQVLSSGGGGQAIRFNSDTGNNYARHNVGGNGSSVFASGTASTNMIFVGDDSASTNLATMIIDIHDYASTTKNKTVRSFFGHDRNGAGSLYLYSGLWMNTGAITSLSLGQANFSGTFDTGTVASLYGIKG